MTERNEPIVGLWLTGPPDAGKTSLGQLLAGELERLTGRHTVLLDADEVRRAYWPHRGHTESCRVHNVMGLAKLATAIVDNHSNVIVAAVSPDRQVRCLAQLDIMRALGGSPAEPRRWAFKEVYVHAPLKVLHARDTKGLYKKDTAGYLFTPLAHHVPPAEEDDSVWVNTGDGVYKDNLVVAARDVLRAVGW